VSASLADELRRIADRLPNGGEDRPQQVRMAEAIAGALETKRHLVVQAGTGTGKSLAYLLPALASGRRVVVATATKALQDQLAVKDLPFLAELRSELGLGFTWAVLKGRSNYICRQRLQEATRSSSQASLDLGDLPATVTAEIRTLAQWAENTDTGDAADLDWSPADQTWRAVSVGTDECPGAARCPLGETCFAETARRRAADADVVVVNTHLYGLDIATGGAILPEHDVVVFDEAHTLEDIMSDTVGLEIGAGRVLAVAQATRRIIDDPSLQSRLLDQISVLRDALEPHLGQRLPDPLPDAVNAALLSIRSAVDAAQNALRNIPKDVEQKNPDVGQAKIRAQQLATRLTDALDRVLGPRDGLVTFVSGQRDSARLEIAPLDVAPVLANAVWAHRTGILTSATLPSSIARRVGLPDDTHDVLDVGSPFDYATNALLYCALHLPDPRSPDFTAACHDEIISLIRAAGGRTLALFTSYRAMDAAAEAARAVLPMRVLSQRDMPKNALVQAFSSDEASCLFATAGFFQGVDIPGRTLSLVIIDRIPFPRPDDPLLSARRDLLGRSAFSEIDLPRASMLLAQATGRLIRTATDRGVVAVLDPRLGTARYRWDIVNALPPMRRTRERSVAEAYLAEITGTDQ
jgi:ATP-dependent DNA helicase DinG